MERLRHSVEDWLGASLMAGVWHRQNAIVSLAFFLLHWVFGWKLLFFLFLAFFIVSTFFKEYTFQNLKRFVIIAPKHLWSYMLRSFWNSNLVFPNFARANAIIFNKLEFEFSCWFLTIYKFIDCLEIYFCKIYFWLAFLSDNRLKCTLFNIILPLL